MNWYAIKTFYRVAPVGRPRGRDEEYDATLATLEERIVIFRARSGESAIRKGVTEARKYAKQNSWTNSYQQAVRTEFLEIAESYEVDGEISEGAEIFSNVEMIAKSESAKSIATRKFGDPSTRRFARQFISGEVDAHLGQKLSEARRKP